MVEEVVMDEKERMGRWMEIEDELLAEDLVPAIPVQEWRGLTLLVENLEYSEKCKADDGRIVASLSREVEVVLLFQEMLRRRIRFLTKHGLDSPDPNSLHRPDCHLDVWIRRGPGNTRGEQWSTQVCIAAPKATELPVTDLAATFVLWAEAGFPNPPKRMAESIEIMRISDNIKDFQSRIEENDRYHEELQLLVVERARRARKRAREQAQIQEIRKREFELAQKEVHRMSWRELIRAANWQRKTVFALPDRIEEVRRGIRIQEHKRNIARFLLSEQAPPLTGDQY